MDDDEGSLQWMAERLAEYADILNSHGSQSPEAREFATKHGWHDELADQMDTARRLKAAAELSATGNHRAKERETNEGATNEARRHC